MEPQPGAIIESDVACLKCQQNLRGVASPGLCPRCGAHVSESLAAVQAKGDVHAIRHDVVCRGCGYDLRGLDDRGRCPECSLPIEQSLKDDLLEYSTLEFVQRLHRGVTLVLVSVAAQLFTSILAGVYELAANTGVIAGSSSVVGALMSVAGLLSILLAVGWWLLTTPDPSAAEDEGTVARRVIRIAILIALLVALAQSAISLMIPRPVGAAFIAGFSIATFVHLGIVILATLVLGVRFFAEMIYIRDWLAPRLPSSKIGYRARELM